MSSVLVIDPDQTVLSFLRLAFARHGFEFFGARRSADVALRLRRGRPSIAISRAWLPDKRGIEFIEELRPIPVILVGLAGDEDELAHALDLGAADVQLFPLDGDQLAARMREILQWRSRAAEPEVVSAGLVTLDLSKRALVQPSASLTANEFHILRGLLDLPGKALTRRQLAGETLERTVDTHVASLRRKIGIDCIETVRGIGYRFRTA